MVQVVVIHYYYYHRVHWIYPQQGGGVGLSKTTGTLFSKNNLYYGGSEGYVDASGIAYDGYLGGGDGDGGWRIWRWNFYWCSGVEGGIGGDGGTNVSGGNNNGYSGGTGAKDYAGSGGGGGGGPPTPT